MGILISATRNSDQSPAGDEQVSSGLTRYHKVRSVPGEEYSITVDQNENDRPKQSVNGEKRLEWVGIRIFPEIIVLRPHSSI